MDGVGDELLTGAVLALNQDVGVAGGHAFDELEEVLHLLALAHHVPEAVAAADLLLQPQVLGPLAGELHRLVEDVDESGLVHRLFEKVERPGLSGLHGARHAALGTDHDDLRRLVDLFQPPEERYPIRVRQLEVGQHHVRAPLPEDFLAPGANQGRPHLVAFGLDDDAKPLVIAGSSSITSTRRRRFVAIEDMVDIFGRFPRRRIYHATSRNDTDSERLSSIKTALY